MTNPYENLPAEAFWRPAIADIDPLQISNIWKPKFRLNKKHNIATSGSCFAQHISKALIARGYNWLDGEPAPRGLSAESRTAFNYGIFSFRTGNIYTAALLKQWLRWALAGEPVPDEVWIKDGRFYDPFRPAIEPNGFISIEELQASRKDTLTAIAQVVSESRLFIFTLGLTEAWTNKQHAYVYPMCPGTVAGEFDASKHAFINYSYRQIQLDLRDSFNLIRRANPRCRFLLTVSPVPLTATASNQHVLVATTYSKSTLRAVAGDMANTRPDVDYFPSYEIITGFPFRAMFFKENLRSISTEGVDFVMNLFFSGLNDSGLNDKGPANSNSIPSNSTDDFASMPGENEVVCEEELLAAFGSKKVDL